MKVLLRTQIDADLIKLEQRVQNFTRQLADLMPVSRCRDNRRSSASSPAAQLR
jgi:hypothetical protein